MQSSRLPTPCDDVFGGCAPSCAKHEVRPRPNGAAMHTRHALISLSAAILAVAVMANATAAATTYTFVDLGAGPNGKDAYAYGASSTAQVGTYLLKTYS